MVYERVRFVQYPPEGGSYYLTENANGNFSKYTEFAPDGRISKIQWELPSTTVPQQAGSVIIRISGTEEAVLTVKNSQNATWTKYPRTSIVDNVNASWIGNASGGNIWAEFVCRDLPIRIVGSGFGGVGSNVGLFKIFYY